MNNKAIAGLGVFVALLTAWLVITLISTPTVSIEKQTSMVPGNATSSSSGEAVTEKNVTSSVKIVDPRVQTSVTIKQ